MITDIANGWLRHDGASASSQYYGYNLNANALDTDTNWSIRQVTTAPVDTVKWSNKTILLMVSTWGSRTQSFASPTGSLGVTYSLSGSSDTYFYLEVEWNLLSGVDRYIISTLDPRGTPISNTGDKIIGQYVTSTYSDVVFNRNYYSQKIVDNNATYSVTIIGENQAGTISQTLYVRL